MGSIQNLDKPKNKTIKENKVWAEKKSPKRVWKFTNGRQINYEWCWWVILRYLQRRCTAEWVSWSHPQQLLAHTRTVGIEKGSPIWSQLALHSGICNTPINIWQIKKQKQNRGREKMNMKTWVFPFLFYTLYPNKQNQYYMSSG